ncbi:hypothetical protein [Acinetobacter baumannii]
MGVPVEEVISQVERLRAIQAEQGKVVAGSFAVDPADLQKIH